MARIELPQTCPWSWAIRLVMQRRNVLGNTVESWRPRVAGHLRRVTMTWWSVLLFPPTRCPGECGRSRGRTSRACYMIAASRRSRNTAAPMVTATTWPVSGPMMRPPSGLDPADQVRADPVIAQPLADADVPGEVRAELLLEVDDLGRAGTDLVGVEVGIGVLGHRALGQGREPGSGRFLTCFRSLRHMLCRTFARFSPSQHPGEAGEYEIEEVLSRVGVEFPGLAGLDVHRVGRDGNV